MHPPREPPAFFNCEEEGEVKYARPLANPDNERPRRGSTLKNLWPVVAGGGLRRRRRVEIAFIPGFIARDLS